MTGEMARCCCEATDDGINRAGIGAVGFASPASSPVSGGGARNSGLAELPDSRPPSPPSVLRLPDADGSMKVPPLVGFSIRSAECEKADDLTGSVERLEDRLSRLEERGHAVEARGEGQVWGQVEVAEAVQRLAQAKLFCEEAEEARLAAEQALHFERDWRRSEMQHAADLAVQVSELSRQLALMQAQMREEAGGDQAAQLSDGSPAAARSGSSPQPRGSSPQPRGGERTPLPPAAGPKVGGCPSAVPSFVIPAAAPGRTMGMASAGALRSPQPSGSPQRCAAGHLQRGLQQRLFADVATPARAHAFGSAVMRSVAKPVQVIARADPPSDARVASPNRMATALTPRPNCRIVHVASPSRQQAPLLLSRQRSGSIDRRPRSPRLSSGHSTASTADRSSRTSLQPLQQQPRSGLRCPGPPSPPRVGLDPGGGPVVLAPAGAVVAASPQVAYRA
eukprot:CAMPEP_0179048114 /NCGR_PEP_ID=MMETSP0796-20121207/19545_1 /TAXON_ID=73915 /ORGANISM="Pyrodinium bahamense, Strain pbaha01" /LENGTH=450 /DNA_ID=CAMNT_0020744579 /DNA_START=18 /DNA_END=1367 /DNA_ORIENTATION=-